VSIEQDAGFCLRFHQRLLPHRAVHQNNNDDSDNDENQTRTQVQ
jgi:hypothetical protein